MLIAGTLSTLFIFNFLFLQFPLEPLQFSSTEPHFLFTVDEETGGRFAADSVDGLVIRVTDEINEFDTEKSIVFAVDSFPAMAPFFST